MHRHVSSRLEFIELARRHGAVINVVRMPTTEVVRQGTTIRTRAAVQLTYSFEHGDDGWCYQETRIADETGRVDLRNTLWEKLEQEGGYRLLQRSGSF